MTSPLIGFRRELHAHPELAHQEFQTAARVVAFLGALCPSRILTGVGGTGVVATFDSGNPGPQVLFRCELDALPIQELGVRGHASTREGVSHKCGHDGHIAMVLGLAQYLAANRPPKGTVHLLFQPAEETGTGAAAVLADPQFAQIRADFGVALHNMPGFPLHSLVIKPGPITAAVRSIVIRFAGRAAHASEPENGESPSLAVADLLKACEAMNVRDQHSPDFCQVTPVHVRVGAAAYGIAPSDGEVHLTFRALANSKLETLTAALKRVAEDLAVRDRLQVTVDVVEEFHANTNDPLVTERVRRAAEACGFHVIRPSLGLRGGEDFGRFAQRFPTCLALLGAGPGSFPLHNSHYDFNDELISTGVRFYEEILRQAFVA